MGTGMGRVGTVPALACSPAHPFHSVVTSWIEKRTVQSEKANLTILFDKYLPVCLEKLKFGFKKITPIPEITVIQMILYLLECLLTPQNTPPDSPRELYELYFVFACTWAFGGAMFQDQVRPRCAHRREPRARFLPRPRPCGKEEAVVAAFGAFLCLVPSSSWITVWSSASGG